MRAAVPPRDFAATVSAKALLRTGWAAAGVLLVLSVVILIDLAAIDAVLDDLWAPFGALGIILVGLVLVALKPDRARGTFYLVVGFIGSFLYQWLVLRDLSLYSVDDVYLINRVAIALVLVGPVGRRLIGGVWWVTAGLLAGTASTLLAQLTAGVPLNPGWGPTIAFLVYTALIVALDRIRVTRRYRMPDFEKLEAETYRLTGQRQLQEHAAALIHDTVLADLDALAHRTGALDERAVNRIRRDVATLRDAIDAGIAERETRASTLLRDDLLDVVREAQWRGLTVEVTGGDNLGVELDDERRSALAGALHAALDNTRKHSRSSEAHVDFRATENELTVMIVDNGVGFDPDTVRADRLGLKTSVYGRITAVGGAVRLWSATGAGTSLVITVPRAPGGGGTTAGTHVSRDSRDDKRTRFTRAPHEIDPLTWLAGNWLPLAFSLLVPTASSLSILGIRGTALDILGQLAAVALMSTACVVVYSFARPVRGPFTRLRALIPVAIAAAATVLSATNPLGVGTVSALLDLENWWAPLGFAFVIGALVPYTSVATSIIIGGIAAIVVGGCAYLAYPGSGWPPASTVAIALVPVVIATAGAIAFQWQVADRVTRWARGATPAVVSGRLLKERARLAAVNADLVTVSAKVGDFLSGIAERAHVTDDDQERAAALAADIRTELVERSNETWLQAAARGRPVTIIDPGHLADTMSEEQSASIHALILTVLDSPGVEYPHLLIEVRSERDATAVAITIDAGLAEGRRIMLLAPHFLSLRATADDLHWKGGDTIRMRFRT